MEETIVFLKTHFMKSINIWLHIPLQIYVWLFQNPAEHWEHDELSVQKSQLGTHPKNLHR